MFASVIGPEGSLPLGIISWSVLGALLVSLSQGIRVQAELSPLFTQLIPPQRALANKAVSFSGVGSGGGGASWFMTWQWGGRVSIAPWFIRENTCEVKCFPRKSSPRHQGSQGSHTNQSADEAGPSWRYYGSPFDWLIFSHVLNAQLSNELESVWVWLWPETWDTFGNAPRNQLGELARLFGEWVLSLQRQVLAIRKPTARGNHLQLLELQLQLWSAPAVVIKPIRKLHLHLHSQTPGQPSILRLTA